MAESYVKSTFSGSDITVYAYPESRVLLNDVGIDSAKIRDLKQDIEGISNKIGTIQKNIENTTGFDSNFINGMRNINNLSFAERDKNNEINQIKESNPLVSDDEELKNETAGQFFIELGSLSDISFSTFREKFAVRSLGESTARSYTRGHRTIAGTMIFTFFNEFEIDRLREYLNKTGYYKQKMLLLDQLPPLTFMIHFANEYGSQGMMWLFDVEFQAEGQTLSINQLLTSKELNYYCKDMIPYTRMKEEYESIGNMLIGARSNITFPSPLNPNATIGKSFQDIILNSDEDSEINKMLADSRNILI